MSDMYQERLEDLSVYYWLVDKFKDTSFVKIVDAFPYPSEEVKLTLPTISVEAEDINGYFVELGNRKMAKERQFYFDVFAKTKSQRDEFRYKLFNDLQNGIPVYDYNMGFPPNVVPTKLGTLIVESLRSQKVEIVPELVDEMYYRAVVILTAVYDKF